MKSHNNGVSPRVYPSSKRPQTLHQCRGRTDHEHFQSVQRPAGPRSTSEEHVNLGCEQHNSRTTCRPTLPTLFLVFGQECDWSGASAPVKLPL